jgi:hypothetical protein
MPASFLMRAGSLTPASALLDGSEADGTNIFTGAPGLTADWNATNATLTTGALLSPDGTTNAANLVENSSTARHDVQQQTPFGGAFVADAARWSVYAKQGSRRYLNFSLYIASAYRLHVFADLQTGTITDSGSTGLTISNQTIAAAVNGFWKVSVDLDLSPLPSTLENGYFIYRISDVSTGSDAEITYAGNGSGNIYLWRPKLVVI